MTKAQQALVSIIMPAHNAEGFISQSIQSVLNQTYNNWELVITDDASTDRTVQVIQSFADPRIKLLQLPENKGAAIARNTAIEQARGDYLAFLDSDDFWHKDKLTRQIAFMESQDILFSSTEYGNVDPDGNLLSVTANHDQLDYEGLLKYCPGNSTVVYNAKVLGKFYIPDIKKRNDFVMWLRVIKKAKTLYGLKETLTYYRVRENSLSKNKTGLVKYQWRVYRKIEHLSLAKSAYLLGHKVLTVKFGLNKKWQRESIWRFKIWM